MIRIILFVSVDMSRAAGSNRHVNITALVGGNGCQGSVNGDVGLDDTAAAGTTLPLRKMALGSRTFPKLLLLTTTVTARRLLGTCDHVAHSFHQRVPLERPVLGDVDLMRSTLGTCANAERCTHRRHMRTKAQRCICLGPLHHTRRSDTCASLEAMQTKRNFTVCDVGLTGNFRFSCCSFSTTPECTIR